MWSSVGSAHPTLCPVEQFVSSLVFDMVTTIIASTKEIKTFALSQL